MKILYITQMYPSEELPQYCAFLHLQVKALINNGVEIVVVIPSTETDTLKTVYDGVDIVYIHYRDYSRSVLYGLVNNQLRNQLLQQVQIADFDVVYAIHSPANILNFARVIAIQYNKPLVVHYRGYNIFEEYNKEPKALFSNPRKVREKVVKESALSIGVSRKTVEIIRDKYPNAPTEVVYNGVDTNVFFCSDKPLENETIRILCVANLIPIKGHKYLFDAVKRIITKHVETTIFIDIVGRGVLEKELVDYVKTNSIPNVNFLGYVHHDKVADFMRSSDIFVLPSIYESFGNVCLEAMACKKPIVIFEGQGIDEIIEDEISGMVAEKGNLDEFTFKLESIILDKKKRNYIAENGYLIAQRYTWDVSGKSIINAIRRVTNIV